MNSLNTHSTPVERADQHAVRTSNSSRIGLDTTTVSSPVGGGGIGLEIDTRSRR